MRLVAREVVEKARATRRPRAGPDADEEEDDANTYSQKLGRWSREVDAAVHTDEFWIVLDIAHVTRGPFMHLENWLESQRTRNDSDKSEAPAMLELVCDKVEEIRKEFEELLDSDHPRWKFLWEEESYSRIGLERQPEFVAVAVTCILEGYSDFFNRILGPCRCFPRLTLWLAHRPASTSCENRMKCAEDLRTAPPDQLDQFCLKFRILFKRELEWAARTGCLSEALWAFMRETAELWLPDMQEVEGCNSQIKTIAKFAPYIKWALLSSRVTIKKRMESTRSAAEREDLISMCVAFHKEAVAMLGDDRDAGNARWDHAKVGDDPSDWGPSEEAPLASAGTRKRSETRC